SNSDISPPRGEKILSPSTLDKIKAILVDKLMLVSQKPRTGIGEMSECNQGNHTLIHTHHILLKEGPEPPDIHKRLTLPQKNEGIKPSGLHEARPTPALNSLEKESVELVHYAVLSHSNNGFHSKRKPNHRLTCNTHEVALNQKEVGKTRK